MPNPSLEPTRYGRRRLAAPGHRGHCLSAAKRHMRAQIAAFKVPERIDIVAEPLPRNANGKILKPEVKKAMGFG